MPTIDYIDREKRTMICGGNTVVVIQPDADKINGIQVILRGDVKGQKAFDGTDTLIIDTEVAELSERDVMEALEG